jgi:soluble lytic murein transglycosylase
LALTARAARDDGRPREAAERWRAVAALRQGAAAGVAWARAADAFAAAADTGAAREAYERAARLLPRLRGWIALRQAGLEPNSLRAFEALRAVPTAGRRLRADVRAAHFLARADTTRALEALTQADRPLEAANLAEAVGDSAGARTLVYQALRKADGVVARGAATRVLDRYPPATPAELLRLVTVVRRDDPRRAAELLRTRRASGDSSAQLRRVLGDLEAALGRTTAALATYEATAASGGVEGVRAAYRRARLLVSIGETRRGYRELEAVARTHPGSAPAPIAAYLVAERAVRRAPRAVAESLLTWVADTWPRHTYGSRSRLQLAALAVRYGDTTTALTWYRREIGVRGEQRFAARFFTAQLRQAAGDTAGAVAHWRRLAAADSLGYYGTIARELVGEPVVRVAAPAVPPPPAPLAAALAELDLLGDVGFARERDVLLEDLLARTTGPDAQLALAEGLSARGWVVEGIRLGWRVAGARSLHDPRVLRVIYPYPWPIRALIEHEAVEHGVDPYLLAAVVRQESAFREAVTSRAGARGLMQLMPTTATYVARRLGVEWEATWLAVPDANLHLGAAHLATLLRRYRRVVPALAAYNAGGTPVARWLRAPDAGDPYRFIEQIPYVETRGYVRAVVRNHSLYRALYPPAPISEP